MTQTIKKTRMAKILTHYLIEINWDEIKHGADQLIFLKESTLVLSYSDSNEASKPQCSNKAR
jgi:hypothetical protein